MKASQQTIDNSFETFVQELPADYQEMAYEFKAFCRGRKVKSVYQLLQLVMLYCGSDFSLRSCAGQFSQRQGYLSDTGVKKRLAACVPWIKAIVSKLFGLEQLVNSDPLRFIVIDGSTVQVPGATGTSYRLHIAIDLVKLTLLQVEVTTDKIGESLNHYSLQNGDVVVMDRGYNQPKSLVPFVDQGSDIVLRYNPHSMNLYQQNDGMAKLDWVAELKKLNGQAGGFPVYLCHKNKRIKATVHAIALPKEQADKARQRARQKAKKKGRTPKKETLYLSGWVLVLTTVASAILNTATIADLYRLRWQVELVIKRLKSLLNIDCLRAKKGSDLAELYLYGKLLYAAVIEKITTRRFKPSPTNWIERTLTAWRPWVLVASGVQSWLISSMPAQIHYMSDAKKALCERPRKRKLQTLPKRVRWLLEVCQCHHTVPIYQ